jgi:feruloyl esterase
MSCEALAGVTVANTTITTAETVAAGAFTPPVPQAPGPSGNFAALPAFCRVTGTIAPTADSDIRFELWLPAENWNGRFLQTGNGGAAGAIVHGSLVDPLLRGYAVANTDTGHQGGGGDFAWAAGHPQKLTDYAHRAVHELTVTGKALTTARFGSAPEKSYWVGCSTGGRQGLKEAQRYPEDYDAIVAGAPANNWSALMALSIVIQNNIIAPGGLGIDKLGILKEAAIASCDALDGVSDRVITNTAQCAFDPAATQCAAGQSAQCLSAAEVAAATRIYQGVVTASGETRFPGTGPASEPLWAAYASPGFGIGSSYFREVVVGDPAWDAASFNVDRDLARAEEVDNGEHIAMNPDLSAFFAHGGKLLTYHGTTDGLIPYRNTVNYYESVVARMGEALVAANMRLYLVPGMDHCAGGEGAFMVDWLTALEDWVEDGTAPATLPAARPAGMPGTPAGSSGFTRPLCPYPQVAQYKGGGATTDAANFSCRAP